MRAALSALGIAIGVAAIVAVLGLSSSSQAGLLAQIDKLGTNLLTVQNGQTLFGQTAELPLAAPGMISRIGPVQQVQYTGSTSANVYRSPLIPSVNTNALSVQAASLGLPATVGATVAAGAYLNAATAREPVAVLGYAAAQRLGIDRLYPGERIWLGGMWFYLAGILNSATLAPEIDASVLVGFPAAERYLGFDGHPTTIYVRSGHEPDGGGPVGARRHRQPGGAERGAGQPALRRAHRARRGAGRAQQPLPRARRRVAARRCGRRRQHHAHRRARAPLRDRAPPRARRDEAEHPHAVPLRSDPARPHRRRGRRHRRRRLDRDLRRAPSTGRSPSPPPPGRAASAPPSSSAPSPASSPQSAPRACRRPRRCEPYEKGTEHMHRRRSLILASVVAVAAFALLAAGCGGGGSPGVASGASTTTAATTTTQNGPLAFARCMRSHGVPNLPDPISGGVFDKSKLRQTGYSVAQVRAVEDGPCNHLLGAVSHQGPTITAADRVDYLKAAACMRSHGFPGFPDPTFQDSGVQLDIPPSIDQDSSRFTSAATICTKLIPAGLPYTRPRGS